MEGSIPSLPGASLSGSVKLFGIRHHGPGSSRSLIAGLNSWKPDCILIEGPQEADALISYLLDPTLMPPVAMLFYDTKTPRYASYYPLAEFSPELQAIRWAKRNEVPVRWMDLPAASRLGVKVIADRSSEPLDLLAQAAGFEDVEDWWEHLVESREDPRSLFEGLEALMAELRQGDSGVEVIEPDEEEDDDPRPPVPRSQMEELREGHMRDSIRQAKENCQRLAAICGAWHLPALRAESKKPAPVKLPKCSVGSTIVPWTYDLLTSASGYGAGARSPAFYDLVWSTPPKEVPRRWLLSVARLMREEDLDASPASVIEAVRLADALAALRDRPRPGLRELSEAANAVLVRDDAIWSLIGRRLIVGDRMGAVPESTPAVPLQDDIARLQKRLRIPVDDGERVFELDLRGETDLERSHLLHRLRLLDIEWGSIRHVGGKQGTFHEHWDLRWRPNLAISVIEASVWGNTVEDAATACSIHKSKASKSLADISKLLGEVLFSALPLAIEPALDKLTNMSATVSDVGDLGDALPALASMLRYGTVRKIDISQLDPALNAVYTRFCLGVPGACRSLDDESASSMSERLAKAAAVVSLLEDEEKLKRWVATLEQIVAGSGTHALILGKAARLLFDFGAIKSPDLADRLRLEASAGAGALHAAAFVEGMLEGPGAILIHHRELWEALDEWLTGLRPDAFDEILPLVRRTFALFSNAERRQLGERLIGGEEVQTASFDWDQERAQRVLPVIRRILGVKE